MLRSTLLKLSESPGFAHWVTSNNSTRSMARRFVAGETLDEAIAAARKCNDAGMFVSLDYLGENVSTTTDAQRARDAYLEIFERIAKEKPAGQCLLQVDATWSRFERRILRRPGSFGRRAGRGLR